jgi:hypothetical protein
MPDRPILNWSVFFRTLLGPLILWGVLVMVVTLAGQPGVVCITPLAWLLALRCGVHYINLLAGQSERYPFLGPALAGAVLGLGEGMIFVAVTVTGMPLSVPGEIIQGIILTAVIVVGGIVVCAALSAFTAWLALRRQG